MITTVVITAGGTGDCPYVQPSSDTTGVGYSDALQGAFGTPSPNPVIVNGATAHAIHEMQSFGVNALIVALAGDIPQDFFDTITIQPPAGHGGPFTLNTSDATAFARNGADVPFLNAGGDIFIGGVPGVTCWVWVEGDSPPSGQSFFFPEVTTVSFSFTPPIPPIPVPDVMGDTLAEATAVLVAAGFVVGTVASVHDETVPVNTVSAQSPTGSATPGTAVNLSLAFHQVGSVPNQINDELIGGAFFSGLLNLVEFVYMPEREPLLAGAANLILNRYKQEPDDNRQRGVDFTFFLVPSELIQTVALVGISAQGVDQAATSPLVTPLVVNNVVLDPGGKKFAYSVSGGQDGVEYTVKFATTTQIQSESIEEIFSINVLIEDQFP